MATTAVIIPYSNLSLPITNSSLYDIEYETTMRIIRKCRRVQSEKSYQTYKMELRNLKSQRPARLATRIDEL